MSVQLAVSIINYRTGDLTLACLASAITALEGLDGQIVVVDNASGDGSAEQIEDWITAHPDAPVTFVRSPTNTGFSGGHNLGMAAIQAELYLLLNSDAILRDGFFQEILKAAEAHPKAGLFAPRIAWEDGTPQVSAFRFASPVSEFIRGINTGWATRILKRWEVAIGTEPDMAAIEWASFACIALRREMIEDIGPMDEGYFLYFEDAEYCLRARRAGWNIIWVPEAVAVHFRGGSGPVKAMARERKRLPGYYYASRARFLYQAHGQAGLLFANSAWVIGRALTQLRRLFGKDIYPAAQKEGRDIWINALTPLAPPHVPDRNSPS